MRTKSIFAACAAFFAIAVSASAQVPVVIHDPLRKAPEKNFTAGDEQLVKAKVLPKIKNRWSDNEDCDGRDLNVIGAADGSFTKKSAQQRAIVYEMCQTGNGFANNGIAIVENGGIVAHFTTAGGWNLEVARLADINKNGFDELAVETGGGMHQGYTGSSVSVLEISSASVRSLGTFLVFTNECENGGPEEYCDERYRITAKPRAAPVFSRQKYINKNGSDEKPKWTVSGKLHTAKPLASVIDKYTRVK